MRNTRPITIIIAAILLAVLALSNFPTRIPGATAGNRTFRGTGNFTGNAGQDSGSGGNQALPGNNGSLTSGGTGDTGANGSATNGFQNFTQNGTRFRQQSSILGIRSGVFTQLVLFGLNLIFLVLGLVAALGLFQLKRWGMILGLVVVAYNLIMAGRSIYTFVSFEIARASGAFGNFTGAAGGNLGGFTRAFPILVIFQILVAIAVAVLALIPASRKALIVSRPAAVEDLGTL